MKSTYINGLCYYQGDGGILLPAVTTILKATQPQESVAGLSYWRKKVGNDEANRIAANSRRRGNALHQLIKQYQQRLSPKSCNSEIKPFWDSVQPVLENLSDIHLIQEVVPNYKESYAGKIDCVARYKGIPHAIEWASSLEPKSGVDKLYDKPLQLVAYGGAINREYGDSLFGCKIKRALIVVALPDEDAQIFQFEREDLIDYWYEWRERLKIFYKGHFLANS